MVDGVKQGWGGEGFPLYSLSWGPHQHHNHHQHNDKHEIVVMLMSLRAVVRVAEF